MLLGSAAAAWPIAAHAQQAATKVRRIEDLKTVGEFTVEAGESIPFVLSYGLSFQSPPQPIDPFSACGTPTGNSYRGL